MKSVIYIYIGLLLGSFGCSDDQVSQQKFVIEGSIFAGEPVDQVKIKEQTPITSPDSIELIINDATVVLSKEGQQFSLQFVDGWYTDINNEISVNSGDLFRIEVTVDDRVAYAETAVPPTTDGLELSQDTMVIPPIEFGLDLLAELNALFFDVRLTARWENGSDDLHFVVVEFVGESEDSLFPEGFPQEGIDFLSSFRFLPEATRADTFEIIGLAFENYGLHKATVYRVNQEYSDLFDNQEQDSRDLTEPPSNVVNGFGIFTAFAADSVFFHIVRE